MHKEKRRSYEKRFVSILLAPAMCMGLAVPGFAAEPNKENVTLEQIEAEIRAEKDRIYATVREQLMAQNAIHMIDTYMEALAPQIEITVKERYNTTAASIVPYSVVRKVYFPNGGMIAYTGKATGANVLSVYMTPDQFDKYIKEAGYSYTLGAIIEAALGYMPALGIAFAAISSLTLVATTAQVYNITHRANEADNGYAQTMSIQEPSGDTSSVLVYWEGHPYGTISQDLNENITTQAF